METLKFKISEDQLVDYKRKTIARRMTAKAVKEGKLIKPSCCDLCKIPYMTVAHHVDYGKPMEIIWLCNECHGRVHRKCHPMNPNNSCQTFIPTVWEERESVHVSL
jgi:hypothetical protein